MNKVFSIHESKFHSQDAPLFTTAAKPIRRYSPTNTSGCVEDVKRGPGEWGGKDGGDV